MCARGFSLSPSLFHLLPALPSFSSSRNDFSLFLSFSPSLSLVAVLLVLLFLVDKIPTHASARRIQRRDTPSHIRRMCRYNAPTTKKKARTYTMVLHVCTRSLQRVYGDIYLPLDESYLSIRRSLSAGFYVGHRRPTINFQTYTDKLFYYSLLCPRARTLVVRIYTIERGAYGIVL